MAILNMNRAWLETPSIVSITTDDDLSTITGPRYLINQESNIVAINGGSFSWFPTDLILIYYNVNQWSFFKRDLSTQVLSVVIAGGAVSGVTVQQLQDNDWLYAPDTGVADAYVMTLANDPTPIQEGAVFYTKIANSNFGASTLTINGEQHPWKALDGTSLAPNSLVTGQFAIIGYDGMQYQLLNSFSVGSGITFDQIQTQEFVWAADSSVGADAYIVSFSPSFTVQNGSKFDALINATGENTITNPTITINGSGYNIVANDGLAGAIAVGDIKSGGVATFEMIGANAVLLNPASSTPSATSSAFITNAHLSVNVSYGSTAAISFPTITENTANAFNGITQIYTVQESGTYTINAQVTYNRTTTSTSADSNISLVIDGVEYDVFYLMERRTGDFATLRIVKTLNLIIGQQFFIRFNGVLISDTLDVVGNADGSLTYIDVFSAGGIGNQAAGNVAFYSNAYYSDDITLNDTDILIFDLVTQNDAGAYNTATGIYTIQQDGIYNFYSQLTMDPNNSSITDGDTVSLYVDGVRKGIVYPPVQTQIDTGPTWMLYINKTLPLLAGQEIWLQFEGGDPDLLFIISGAVSAGASSFFTITSEGDIQLNECAFRAQVGAGQLLTAPGNNTFVPVICSSVDFQNNTVYNTTTGEWVVTVAGVYNILSSLRGTLSATAIAQIRRNGNIILTAGPNDGQLYNNSFFANTNVQLAVDDVITFGIFFDTLGDTFTIPAETVFSNFFGATLSGSSAAGSGNSPSVSAYRSTDQLVTVGGGTTTIVFDSVELSGFNNFGYNTGTGIWTCPETGLYEINLQISADLMITGSAALEVNIDGISIINQDFSSQTETFLLSMTANKKVLVNVGQQVEVRVTATDADLNVTGGIPAGAWTYLQITPASAGTSAIVPASEPTVFKYTVSSAQTFGPITGAAIALDEEIYDTENNYFSPGFLATEAGWYLVNFAVRLQPSSGFNDGAFQAQVLLGAFPIDSDITTINPSTDILTLKGSTPVYLDVGSFLSLGGFNSDSVVSVDVFSGQDYTYLAVSKLNLPFTQSGSNFAWETITGTTQQAENNTGYVVGNAAATTITMPVVAQVGDLIVIQGYGAGGWTLQFNGGQIGYIGQTPTSSGGTIASAASRNSLTMVCVVANTEWNEVSSVTGGFTIL